ncbi:hypothetical protein E2L03_08465 [Shouchella lehensis]|uniref:LysR substrate-binding domain-containing protein n=1 Tax=Shouchella lehensis TaxID=300825 RepID=A0A4Y7WLW7_9BACI|nr:hypothetical protein E2L03_08465 [Shouchella lehensis]
MIGKLSVMELGSVDAIIRFVALGLGMSLVTESAMKTQGNQKVQIIEVPEKFRKYCISFIYQHNRFRTDAFNHFTKELEIFFT